MRLDAAAEGCSRSRSVAVSAEGRAARTGGRSACGAIGPGSTAPVPHVGALAEHEVAGAVQSLMAKGWVAELEMAGARTRRYEHRAREQLGVDDADLAILAELILRGPQSPQELEKRAARMRSAGDAVAVEA